MRLSEWRRSQGMVQAELAQHLGCSQSYVSQMERAVNPMVPGPALIVEIYVLSKGAVEPNDFYDLPPIDRQAAA